MINLLIGDLKNEYHHMNFYLWASVAVSGLHREEFSEFFSEAAKSEMSHVREFYNALLTLGYMAVPPDQQAADYIEATTLTDVTSLLKYAIGMEEQVVANYTQRIKDAEQLGGSDGKYLEIFLENQLLDSKNDSTHMQQMMK